MLNYAESFGLVLFVYALGLQVGPGFFSSFRKEGVSMNIAGLVLIAIGSLMAAGISWITGYGIDDITGVLCGATTNTPALAAAQQTLKQLGMPADAAALGCAVTYPIGVVGVIFVIIILRKFFTKPDDLKPREESHADQTYVATFEITNPGIEGHTIHDVKEGKPGAIHNIAPVERQGFHYAELGRETDAGRQNHGRNYRKRPRFADTPFREERRPRLEPPCELEQNRPPDSVAPHNSVTPRNKRQTPRLAEAEKPIRHHGVACAAKRRETACDTRLGAANRRPADSGGDIAGDRECGKNHRQPRGGRLKSLISP